MFEVAKCAQKQLQVVRDKKQQTHINIHKGKLFKSIILSNADKLTIDGQSALRRSIELFSHNTRFFIVVEDKYKLLMPILSRFCEIYLPLPIINNKQVNLHQYRIKKLQLENNEKKRQAWIKKTLIDKLSFLDSMRTSFGVICNSGFQTTSEVLYLGKRLLTIPVKGQYEQICNVEALNEIGVVSMTDLNNTSHNCIKDWLSSIPIKINFKNNLEELLLQKMNRIRN